MLFREYYCNHVSDPGPYHYFFKVFCHCEWTCGTSFRNSCCFSYDAPIISKLLNLSSQLERGKMLPPATRSPITWVQQVQQKMWRCRMKKCKMYGIVWLILVDFARKSRALVASVVASGFLLQMFHPQIGCHFICIYIYKYCLGASRV